MLKRKLSTIITFLLFPSINAEAAINTDNQIVDKNKSWTIKFNQEVMLDDISKQRISVADNNSNIVNVSIIYEQDNKTIIVNASLEGYKGGGTYYLSARDKLKSKNNKTLSFNKKQLHNDHYELRIKSERQY